MTPCQQAPSVNEWGEKNLKTAAYYQPLVFQLCFGAAVTPYQFSEMVFSSWIPTLEVSQRKATDKWFNIVLHLPAHFPQDYPLHVALNSSQVVL